MANWNEGYVTDIGYTYGYYNELNPMRIKLAFLAAGLHPPEIGTACELGFGQGMSVNIHAAASMTQWHGTDFNPSQASFAKHLVAISGSEAHLFDQAFQEFCNRADLPEFDYIGLHGIWSWISDDNRAAIVDFVRRKLKVGGLLYISYNTLPGWSAFAPLRHLMAEHSEVFGSNGKGMVNKINESLEFTEKFLATQPGYVRAIPVAGERFKSIKTQNRNYLAHEYFNLDWEPMYFSTMAEWLSPAKLSYACSAHLLDHIDTVNLTLEQRQILAENQDPMFKETLRDYMVNQQFRRDFWVKGPVKLPLFELNEALGKMRFLLLQNRADASLKVTGALGEGTLSEEIYAPFFDLMADHKPRSLAQVEQSLKGKLTAVQLKEAVILLAGSNQIAIVQEDHVTSKAKKTTSNLNQYILSRAKGSNDFNYLASPVTGGGISVGRFQQLFLLAYKEGKKLPAELAQAAWGTLAQQGQKIIKDGKPLEDAEENIKELNAQAIIFIDKQLPILKALQIA